MEELQDMSPANLWGQFVRGLWWLVLIRGLLMIALGAFALFQPGMTLIVFATFVGIYLMLEGLLTIYVGATGQLDHRFWTVVRGVVLFLVGVAAIAQPMAWAAVSTILIVCLLGIAALFSGFVEILHALRNRHQIEGEGWLILSGAFSVVFGFILVWSPLLAGFAIIQVLGAFAIVGGVALVITAFRLRSFADRLGSRR